MLPVPTTTSHPPTDPSRSLRPTTHQVDDFLDGVPQDLSSKVGCSLHRGTAHARSRHQSDAAVAGQAHLPSVPTLRLVSMLRRGTNIVRLGMGSSAAGRGTAAWPLVATGAMGSAWDHYQARAPQNRDPGRIPGRMKGYDPPQTRLVCPASLAMPPAWLDGDKGPHPDLARIQPPNPRAGFRKGAELPACCIGDQDMCIDWGAEKKI